MRRLSLALALCFALPACDCGTSTPSVDAGHADAAAPVEGCTVDFSFRPTTTANSVFVVGEWDGFDRDATPMTADASGTWTARVKVPPGSWGYFFLADGAEAVDPANPDTVQRGGKTCSLLGSCSLPASFIRRVTIPGVDSAETITVVGEIREPDGLAFPASTWRALSAGEMTVEKTTVTLRLSNLPDGKYTVRLKPSKGEEVVLPFWIEDTAFNWRDSPMYMLMIDRFRNGEPANDPPATTGVPTAASFQGGDLQGVEKAIKDGWFDKLGVKAIWITPWQTQPAGSFPDDSGQHQVLGYHGYWPVKAREVDPRFGGGAALAAMVREAHKHGIRIVMDTVLNHVHEEHEYFKDPAKKPWFRTQCVCGNDAAGCGWEAWPGRLYCQFAPYMPDVDWTNAAAADQFVADTLWWLDTFDVDGLRVDAVKHVETAAIQKLATAVRSRFERADTKYLMYGESFTGDVGLINAYVGAEALDGQFDFPLFFNVPEPVFGNDGQGLQRAKGETYQSLTNFGDAYMVKFIGSHDSARFITKADYDNNGKQGSKWDNLPGMPSDARAYDRLWSALVHLMTIPAVPLLYYGDEYGEYGGSDPDNRHFMRAEASLNAQQSAQLARTRKLLVARSGLRGLRRGPMVELWCNSDAWGASGGNLWAFARPDPDPAQGALVVLSLKYESWTGIKVDFPQQLGWPASGTLVDALSDKEYAFTGASATVDVPGRGGVVLRLK